MAELRRRPVRADAKRMTKGRADILRAMRRNPGITPSELARMFPTRSLQRIWQEIQLLCRDGHLVRIPTSRRRGRYRPASRNGVCPCCGAVEAEAIETTNRRPNDER